MSTYLADVIVFDTELRTAEKVKIGARDQFKFTCGGGGLSAMVKEGVVMGLVRDAGQILHLVKYVDREKRVRSSKTLGPK